MYLIELNSWLLTSNRCATYNAIIMREKPPCNIEGSMEGDLHFSGWEGSLEEKETGDDGYLSALNESSRGWREGEGGWSDSPKVPFAASCTTMT